METEAAVEKQERFFHSSLQNAWGRFAQFPQAPLPLSLNNQFRVGQYCSIKVGQFYVVKKSHLEFACAVKGAYL